MAQTRQAGSETVLAGKNESLRGMYDREASRYDARRYDAAEGRLFSALEIDYLLANLELASNSRVLDMPAGTGRLSVALAGSGATVVGADISENMLRVAASKVPAGTGPRPSFVQGSGLQLPFADDTFDAVVCFKFFHLIPNELKPQFMLEFRRVLKPGRKLVVEFNSPFYGVFLATLRYYFRKKKPGGMRMKCLFPDQVQPLFDGFEIVRKQGIKLPLSGALSSILGATATGGLNKWFGSLPGLRYLTYALIIEAVKPGSPGASRP